MHKLKKILISSILASTLVAASSTPEKTIGFSGSINNYSFTNKDFISSFKSLGLTEKKYNLLDLNQKKKIQDFFIDNELLKQLALKEMKDDTTFIELQNKSKKNIAFTMWKDRISNIDISDDIVESIYSSNSSVLKKETIAKAYHILVKSKEEASSIISILKNDKDILNSFKIIAKDKSIGPSKINGGSLGSFNPNSMVKPFRDTILSMHDHELFLEPVKTQFGYHVIYLDSIESKNVNKETVLKNLKKELKLQKINMKMIESIKLIKKFSTIKINGQ
jgi:parvulin-like peptidyl-prolyl isomerase